METTYYSKPADKMMYRIISATEVILLQVKGRDLGSAFSHKHEKVTFPTPERLSEDISGMSESNSEAWEELMNEYLQVNKEKLSVMNAYRQRKFEAGTLKL